jgi:deoxycytidylate deaminase
MLRADSSGLEIYKSVDGFIIPRFPISDEYPKSVQRGIFNAAKLASLSECPSFRVGAILVKNGGRVLGTGWNWFRKTCPGSQTRNNGIHAEFHCFRRVFSKCSDLDYTYGAVLYVARISPHGLAMAKPCDACQDLIRCRGLKRIYYTNREGGISEFVI